MTKKELLGTHSAQLTEILGSAAFKALIYYARANCPSIGGRTGNEPTFLVNNEGKIQGYFEFAHVITTVLQPTPEVPNLSGKSYQRSQFPETKPNQPNP